MSRKFWTSYTALIANYSANQNVNQFSYPAGLWVEGTLITANPAGTNLISMAIGAATIGNARCLKTSYAGNAVVPITCTNGIWSVSSAVGFPVYGSPSDLAISLDGVHALVAKDNSGIVDAVKFNTGTGLWVPNGYLALPESNLTNIRISPDGLRGICVPKSSSNAYPLFRDPSTDVWSAGSAIALGISITRFFSASIDPTGTVCLIGGGTGADALFWNGSTWTRAAVSQAFMRSRWLSDGTTVLTVDGEVGTTKMQVLAYDSGTKTFSLTQTVPVPVATGLDWIAVPELGRQDIAIATDFSGNKLVPFTKTSGTWSVGTLVSSANFYNPLASVIMPLVAA